MNILTEDLDLELETHPDNFEPTPIVTHRPLRNKWLSKRNKALAHKKANIRRTSNNKRNYNRGKS